MPSSGARTWRRYRAVCGGAAAVPTGRTGEAGHVALDGDQSPGECVQAQGDELWADGEKETRAGGGVERLLVRPKLRTRPRTHATVVASVAMSCPRSCVSSGHDWRRSERPSGHLRKRRGVRRKQRAGSRAGRVVQRVNPGSCSAELHRPGLADNEDGATKAYVQGYNCQVAVDAECQVIVSGSGDAGVQRQSSSWCRW